MKSFLILGVFLGGIFFSSLSVPAAEGAKVADKTRLDNVDAARAVAIANEWRWSQKEIRSSVDSRQVFFRFPDGETREIPLPAEEMVVALAPYIRETHA